MSGRERLVGPLLALAVLGLGGTLLCAWGWLRAAGRPGGAAALSPEERQELVADLLAVSPGVFEPAWYEPAIGYTLRRGAEIEAWGDRFESNELGFRSGPPAKAAGTFRVVFLGDSWAYGMGVRERESFPQVFAELANRHAGIGRSVEAWTLALPGWNTLSETAAFWFFFSRLSPDGVVLCLSSNDGDSLARVLPGGSLALLGVERDEFGDPHAVAYPLRQVASHRFRTRWRMAMDAAADLESRLARRRIPLLVDFVARWRPPLPHALAHEAGLASPYVITPVEYTHGRWLNPPPLLHANPDGNRVLGAIAYQAWSQVAGWGPLPAGEAPEAPLFRATEEGPRWTAAARQEAAAATLRDLPDRFRPGREASRQAAGPLDPETGLLGRATTVLIRRRAGAEALRLAVRRLPESPQLYPLTLEVSIPSEGGGTAARVEVPAEGEETFAFTLPMPADVPPGAALDVVLVAGRTAAAPDLLSPRSLYLEAIDQLP